jgi:hypothetical protein
MTRINNDAMAVYAGSAAAPLGCLLDISSIAALLLPNHSAPDSLTVIILQQIEKSQKHGKIIVCL